MTSVTYSLVCDGIFFVARKNISKNKIGQDGS